MSHQGNMIVQAGMSISVRLQCGTLDSILESQSITGNRPMDMSILGAASPPDDRIRRCVTPSSKNPRTRRASFGTPLSTSTYRAHLA